MIKITLLGLILLSIHGSILCQTALYDDTNLPTEIRIGNNSSNVDLSQGIVNPVIPLVELSSSSGHMINVDLVYTSGQGVRVNDLASRVGLGWDINAGGTIKRVVKGIPDETQNGGWLSSSYSLIQNNGQFYYVLLQPNVVNNVPTTLAETYLKYLTHSYFTPLNSNSSSNITDLAVRALLLRKMMEKKYSPLDGEPDVFHFNVGGYSGKFIFDEFRNIRLLPHQDIKIEAPAPFKINGGNEWIITTPDGKKYIFSNSDASINEDITAIYQDWNEANIIPDHYSQWYLSEINYNGKTQFSYFYNNLPIYSIVSETHNYLYYVGTQVDGENCTEDKLFDDLTLQIIWNLLVIKQDKELYKITSDLGEIIFENSVDYRKDRWYNGSVGYAFYPLKAIKKYTKEGELIKHFEFNTNYFFNGNTYNHGYSLSGYIYINYKERYRANVFDRLKLMGVKEFSTNGISSSLDYEFIYHYTPPDFCEPAHQDQWGFYKHNNVLYPNGNPTLMPLCNDVHIFNPYLSDATPPILTNNYPFPNAIDGFDRSAVGSIPHALMLSTIKHPTGMMTQYVYEQNNYYHGNSNTNKVTGGTRIKSIIQIDSHSNIYPANKIDYIYTQWFNPSMSSGQVAPPRKNYNYQTYYCSWDTYGIYFQKSTNGFRESSSEIVRYSNVAVEQAGAGRINYSFTSFGDFPDIAIERKHMKVHSRLNYCDIPYNPGTLNGPFYAGWNDYNAIPVIEGQDDAGAPLIDMSYKRGILLHQKYYKEIPPGLISENFVIKEVVHTYNFNLIHKEVSAYRVNSDYHPAFTSSSLNTCYEYLPHFNLDIFKYVSGSVTLSKTTETVYELVNGVVNKNKSFTTVTDFDYAHSPLRLKKKIVKNLDCSEDYYEEYKYAADFAPTILASNYITDDDLEGIKYLILNNQGGTVLETVYGNTTGNFNNLTGNIVHGKLNTFRKHIVNNYAFSLPHESYTLELWYPANLINFPMCSSTNYPNQNYFTRHAQYTPKTEFRYNQDKKLIATKILPGEFSSVKYGYDQRLVIAKFDNANIVNDECDYTGFEHFGTSQTMNDIGWGISNSNVTNVNSYTGEYCYKIDMVPQNQVKNVGPQKTFHPERQGRLYVISGWVLTPMVMGTKVGRVGVTILHENGTPFIIGNIKVGHSYKEFEANGLWTYYEKVIDLAKFKLDYSSELVSPNEKLKILIQFKNYHQGFDFYVDDIIFRPYYSTAETYNYNERYMVSSQSTESGDPMFTQYDHFDRVKFILDKNKNVIESRDYYIRADWQQQLGTDDKNYTSVTTYRVPVTVADLNTLNSTDYIKNIVYTDDLGRPIQKIAVGQTPNGSDIIQHLEYEAYNGREIKKYLPYTLIEGGGYRPDAKIETLDFYENNTYHDIPNSEFPFAEALIDNSPLGNLIKQGSPGEEWQLTAHPKRFDYSSGLSIINWSLVNYEEPEIPDEVEGVECSAAILSLSIAYDEDYNKIINYTNNLGKTVLTRKIIGSMTEPNTGITNSTFDYTDGTMDKVYIYDPTFSYDTYFVYDDFGRLIYEIPPPALQYFKSKGIYKFNISDIDDPNSDFIYREHIIAYKYDSKGRLIAKKPAGIDWIYYVYDRLDRVVLSQNPKQRDINEVYPPQWSFTKFDELGRVIQTGIIKTSSTQPSLQGAANTGPYFEKAYINNNQIIYTNNAFPQLATYDEVWITNYYDSYESGWASFDNTYLPNQLPHKNTFNLLTGKKVKVLNSNPAKYLLSVYFYDDHYNVIQEISENYLNGYDKYSNLYDYKGKLLTSWRSHTNGQVFMPVTTRTRYDYDHSNRVTKEYHKTNSSSEIILADLQYNVLGKLSRKSLHGVLNTSSQFEYIQSIDYKTNIRGWIKSINNSNLYPEAPYMDDNDVFGEELLYTQNDITEADYVNTAIIPCYNGNIAAMSWKTKAPNVDAYTLPRHLYSYRYDAANRMTAAYYALSEIIPNNHFTQDLNFYDERLSYDMAGNPLTLKRNAFGANPIDDLRYQYHSETQSGDLINSNRLRAIEDQVAATGYGFNNNASLPDEYLYDKNGSIIENKNKNSTTTYTYFDLPENILIGNNSIDYVYDATGKKLAEIINNDVHYYIDGIEYFNNKVQQIMTSEGRIRPFKDYSTFYTYDYYLKDHLHNVRAVITHEVIKKTYLATVEPISSDDEKELFLNIDETREDKDPQAPPDPEYTPDEKVSETNASDGRNIGFAKVMELMQGDVIDFETKYYYEEFIPVQHEAPVATILSQLANIFIFNATSIAGVPFQSEAEQMEWANSTFLQNGEVTNFLIENFGDTNRIAEAPYAYLTWLYFNNRFQFVPEVSGMLLAESPDVLGQLGVEGLEMPVDGFLYIYVNNESSHDVQFDNLKITYNPGLLLQVNHYYPYGLPIKELSTQPGAKTYSDHLMTTKEWNTEHGLNEYDFGARSYDPVTARWYVQDPAEQFYNPYLAIGNNPVVLYDPDGEFIPILIGIGAGILMNAINPHADKSFEGFAKAAVLGGISGAVGWGVGSLIGPAGGFGTEAFRALAHANSQTILSGALGQQPNFGSWASAAFGSLGGSALHGQKPGVMIGGSAVTGGIGSVMAGGTFHQGAIMGGLMASVNHAMHKIQQNNYERAQKRIEKAINEAAAAERAKNIEIRNNNDPWFEESMYNIDFNSEIVSTQNWVYNEYRFQSNNLSIGNQNLSGEVIYTPSRTLSMNKVTSIGWKNEYRSIVRPGGTQIKGHIVQFFNNKGYVVTSVIMDQSAFRTYTNYLIGK